MDRPDQGLSKDVWTSIFHYQNKIAKFKNAVGVENDPKTQLPLFLTDRN